MTGVNTRWQASDFVSWLSLLAGKTSVAASDPLVDLGKDTYGVDLKVYGDTTSKYLLWDSSADTLYVVGNLSVTGTMTETGNKTVIGTLTVGVNDTGHDVKLFGATSGKYWLWDESADTMIVVGASQFSGAVTVGVDDTGYDVKMFGATASKYWLWDESADKMIVVGDSQFTGAVTVGVDDTGHDVKMFGATAGSYLLWDESADTLILTNSALTVGGIITGGTDGEVQGILKLWDGNGGALPAYVSIASPNGTVWYLFVEDDGTVKVHNAAPTQNSDGSEVGGQS